MKTMKRILVSLLLALMILMCVAPAAMAAGTVTTVDITGKHDTFLFNKSTSVYASDLFANFKNVFPGDSLTQQVKITHKGIGLNSFKIYMRVVPHGPANKPVSDVTWQESNEFLSQLDMTIKKGSKTLFNGHPNESDGLTEFTYLGQMHKGGSMNLDVTLDVPITMGNEFADRMGEMDWEFMIEEIPSTIPKTGDETPIGLLMTVMIISLLALVLVVFFLRKKKKK